MFTKKQAHILHILHKSRPSERVLYLKAVDNDIIKLIAEMALNTLRGNIHMSPNQLRRLKRHKQILRTLASHRVGINQKRSILIHQKGGFLPLLLPIIANAVGGLLGSLWNK